ncbi:hypothetical protein ID866_11850 [Astraeus odoratus]|nr:hypothetical protein ID866_11850 [Astraeus odoratus]
MTQFLPWAYVFQGPAPRFEVHPLLNGEVHLHFNLAIPTYSPMRVIGPGQLLLLSGQELNAPATNPPIRRMRITHHAIPQWPIDIKVPYRYQTAFRPSYVTVGDVLYTMHTSLRRQISHRDWAGLWDSGRDAVTRAYTRRCQRYPSFSEREMSRGVRRIDFLREWYTFKELIKADDEDGFFHWRMTTH